MDGQQRVGFIGLGAMGGRMAARVLGAGYPLTVWARRQEATAALVAQGARVAPTAREVASTCDVVLTMLSDPAAVQAVLAGPDGLWAGAHAGLTLVDMSTIGPADARSAREEGARHGVAVLHAPVLGSLGPAQSGELVVLLGGDQAAAERQRPLLATMSRAVRYLGSNEAACALKLSVNALLAGSLQLLGEAVGMAERWGLSRDEALGVLGDTPVVSPALTGKMAAMYDPAAPVAFSLRLARKDLWLALAAGYEKGAALPIVAAALETYTLALADHADEDFARVAAYLEQHGGPHTR